MRVLLGFVRSKAVRRSSVPIRPLYAIRFRDFRIRKMPDRKSTETLVSSRHKGQVSKIGDFVEEKKSYKKSCEIYGIALGGT